MSNAELLKFVDLFEDQLTLDNLDRAQLLALGKLVHIRLADFNTPQMLRFQLKMKLQELRADDKVDAITLHYIDYNK